MISLVSQQKNVSQFEDLEYEDRNYKRMLRSKGWGLSVGEVLTLNPSNRPVVEAPESEGATTLSEAVVASERREPNRGRDVYPASRAKYAFWWEIGTGDSKADCGDWLKSIGCPSGEEGHERWNILNRCDHPLCPVCCDHWAKREAFRASQRFVQAECLYGQMQRRLGTPKHVIFSPPQEEAKVLMGSKEGAKKLKKMCYKWAKWAGIRGGLLRPHAFRGARGREYLSPHFHIVGYGYLVKADVFHEHTGWVYKNKGVRDSVPATIKYELTHGGVAYDDDGNRIFHAVAWFGDLSNSQMVIDHRETEHITIPCGVCGLDLHEYNESRSTDMGVFLMRVERTVWRLRKQLVQSHLPPP